MSPNNKVIVVYATATAAREIDVDYTEGMNVAEAIHHSKIASYYPGIDILSQAIGVNGQIVTQDQLVYPHDRVEIYRPITADPKARRFLRVKNLRL